MPLIIDGNNLLHAHKPAALAGLDEVGLCRALAHTPWRSEGARIVCDGEPAALGRLESPVAGVELIYSGRHRTADAVIVRMIAESTAPRRLTVVSSDRQIQRAARQRRARAWTSEHFARQLAAALAARRAAPSDPGAADRPHVPEGEVRRWLEAFGYDASEIDRQLGADEPGEPNDADDDTRYWPPW